MEKWSWKINADESFKWCISHGTFSGDIVKSKHVKFNNIKDSEKEGVTIIYQELALIKQMNVCENIFSVTK